MWEYRTIGDGTRPPWWRTAILIVVTALGSLVALVFSPWSVRLQAGPAASGLDAVLILIGLVVVIALPASLAWRHRYPFRVLAAASLVPLVIPVGVPVALVALSSLLGRRAGRAADVGLAGASASITWITVADWLAQPRGASVLKSVFGPTGGDPREPSTIPFEVMLVTLIAVLVASIAAGLLTRSRRETHAARHEANVRREASDRLGDEVARHAERERIAREVHDVLGHRLSLLNLHAGALEANAGADPRLAESARLVRTSAAAALDDLRSLLAVLREPLGTEPPDLPLTRLNDVVNEAFGAGQPLSSSIFIADADTAAPALSRAVYRIVQELLTNVRKHAPGEQALLRVNGDKAEGVTIECRNRLTRTPPPASPTAGTSRGLAGITERAELLGGKVTAGLDERGTEFRVLVHLPWRSA